MSQTGILYPCAGHAYESDRQELQEEMGQYYRHISGDYDFEIDIEPMPTPRPRATVMTARATGKQFVNIYNPADYTKYKSAIAILLKDARLGLKKGNYGRIFVTFYMTYPKSTPKKDLIDNAPHIKKPDWDNYIKGLQDAMQDAGIMLNDSAVSDGAVRKRYTLRPKGYIAFSLFN